MLAVDNKKLAVYFKGLANHHRLKILFLLEKHKQLSLTEIIDLTRANVKTISGHTNKLVQTGLIDKTYRGRLVVHTLSPSGHKLIKLIRTFVTNTK